MDEDEALERQGSLDGSIVSLNDYSNDSSDLDEDRKAKDRSGKIEKQVRPSALTGQRAVKFGEESDDSFEATEVERQTVDQESVQVAQVSNLLEGRTPQSRRPMAEKNVLRITEQDHQNLMDQRQKMKEVMDVRRDKLQKKLSERTIPFVARFLLSPFQLYQMYGIFPWGLLFHVMLVFTMSSLCITLNHGIHAYARQQQSAFYKVFLDDAFDSDDVFLDRQQTFYSVDEMLATIDRSVTFYLGQEPHLVKEEGLHNDFLDGLQGYMCRVIEHKGLDPEARTTRTASAGNLTVELPRQEGEADDAALYFGNYTAFGIQCPGAGDHVFRAPVVMQMQLRGDDVHTRVEEEEWMGPELRNASLILGGSFINIIINNEKTLELVKNATTFKKLINYTDSISI